MSSDGFSINQINAENRVTLIKRSFTLYLLPLKQDDLHRVISDRYWYKLLFKISSIDSAIYPDNLLRHVAVSALRGASHVGYKKIQKGLGATITGRVGKVE